MNKSTSKATLKKRLGGYCVDLEGCNQVMFGYGIDYLLVILFYT